MDVLCGSGAAGWLREVEVRPVRGVEERRRWDALMREHHCLPLRGLFGKSLRHVAVRGGSWLALLGWQAGALKVGVRDSWIGCPRERQFARLRLIASNARFAVLPAGRVPNLASRALGRSLRRLAGDFRDAHGCPMLLAETFVDPSRFEGTCHRASNWVCLGRTRGFSREPGGSARWRGNGQPKEVRVYEIEGGAAGPGAAAGCGRVLQPEPAALHGKDVRGASRRAGDGRVMLVAAVKDNQPTMLDDLRAIGWSKARHADGGWQKGHGRPERRRLLKPGAQSRETAYGLTSLDAGRAGPEETAALVRRHWEIENRLHCVRDFTYDEDRCRAHVGNLPRNLACLTNAAISIVRREGRFRLRKGHLKVARNPLLELGKARVWTFRRA